MGPLLFLSSGRDVDVGDAEWLVVGVPAQGLLLVLGPLRLLPLSCIAELDACSHVQRALRRSDRTRERKLWASYGFAL